MKKLGRYAVSALVAALILFGGFLLVANLYVQSRAVQQRIRQGLSASLRMPVLLKKTTYTPWDGLRIDGISAHPVHDPSDAGPGDKPATYLLARSFRVQFGLATLVRISYEVEDVLLDHPRLSWAQNANNRWQMPFDKPLPPDKPDALHKKGKEVPPLPPEPSPPSGGPPDELLPGQIGGRTAEPPPDAPTKRTAAMPLVAIHTLRVRHGSMDFLNHRRGLLGRFEEVTLDGRMPDLDHLTGSASVGRASLPRVGLKLEQVRTDFAYGHAEGLTVNGASAKVADGTLQADCRVQTGEAGTPFEAQCRMENVSLDQLIKEAGGKLGRANGRLQGTLNVSGYTNDPTRATATGDVQLVNGEMHNFSFFQTLGTALRIDDLRHLQFKTARLAYKLDGTTMQIRPISLASNNLRLDAEGSYLMDEDHLDLHARLTIDALVSRQLPKFVEDQFTPCGDEMPGGHYVEFNISGPLNKPTSNLYQRMVPDTLNGLLDRFLAPHPKRGKDKNRKPKEPLTSPTPAEEL